MILRNQLRGNLEMNLQQYIDIYFSGNQAEFARNVGVRPQQVTQWINRGFIMFGGKLYSPRRTIKPLP